MLKDVNKKGVILGPAAFDHVIRSLLAGGSMEEALEVKAMWVSKYRSNKWHLKQNTAVYLKSWYKAEYTVYVTHPASPLLVQIIMNYNPQCIVKCSPLGQRTAEYLSSKHNNPLIQHVAWWRLCPPRSP